MIKVYSLNTHYLGSYLLNILFKKKNQKQLLKKLQTDFLASKYTSKSMSTTGFLIKYKFSSIVTEAKLQQKSTGRKKEVQKSECK